MAGCRDWQTQAEIDKSKPVSNHHATTPSTTMPLSLFPTGKPKPVSKINREPKPSMENKGESGEHREGKEKEEREKIMQNERKEKKKNLNRRVRNSFLIG